MTQNVRTKYTGNITLLIGYSQEEEANNWMCSLTISENESL